METFATLTTAYNRKARHSRFWVKPTGKFYLLVSSVCTESVTARLQFQDEEGTTVCHSFR